MLMHVTGRRIHPKLMIHAPFFEALNAHQVSGGWRPRPEHLVPLGETAWPERIKQQLVRLYQGIGVSGPLKQKLVEPCALFFGGRKAESGVDLSTVRLPDLISATLSAPQAIGSSGAYSESTASPLFKDASSLVRNKADLWCPIYFWHRCV